MERIKKWFNKLKNLDGFGEKVSLNFRGRETYQTKLGGTFTLTIITLMVYFILGRLTKFFNRLDPIVSEVTQVNDILIDKTNHNWAERRFNMGVGAFAENWQNGTKPVNIDGLYEFTGLNVDWDGSP